MYNCIITSVFHEGYLSLSYLSRHQAYYWLRQNTAEDAKVMSWWDYGYQITAMANRTILVDNNTWNNTHISRVGQVSYPGYCLLDTVAVDTIPVNILLRSATREM